MKWMQLLRDNSTQKTCRHVVIVLYFLQNSIINTCDTGQTRGRRFECVFEYCIWTKPSAPWTCIRDPDSIECTPFHDTTLSSLCLVWCHFPQQSANSQLTPINVLRSSLGILVRLLGHCCTNCFRRVGPTVLMPLWLPGAPSVRASTPFRRECASSLFFHLRRRGCDPDA